MRVFLMLAVIAAVVACDLAPTVPGRTSAYPFTTVPRFPGDTARVLRWPVGANIRVFISSGGDARAAILEQAFEHAASAWNDVALYGEYELERAESASEADVVLTWSDALAVVDASACVPNVGRAATTFCLVAAQDRLELARFPLLPVGGDARPGRVKMLVTVLGSETAPQTAARLVTHELGHVLGIARHSPNAGDLMFETYPAAVPSLADGATVQVLYHTPADVTP